MSILPKPRSLLRLAALTQRARVHTETNLHAGVLLRGKARLSPGRVLETLAKEHPHQSALLFEERHYSYASLNAAANRVSSTLISMGAQPRDSVCVLMDNRPELLFTLLGANKLGVVSLLPAPELDDSDLIRAMDASDPRWIVVSGSELPRVERILKHLAVEPHNVLVWNDATVADLPPGVSEMNRLVSTAKDTNPRSTGRQTGSDICLHLPESSNHGARRTAQVSNLRLLRTGTVLGRAVLRISPDDVAYVALPLQSTHGLAAWSAALSVGGTVALRRRFEVEPFWRDVARYGATYFPYDGALAEALLEAPTRPRERAHRARLAMGQGLTAERWEKFEERFGLSRIVQYVEGQAGNVFLFNATGERGMLGRLGPGHRVARLSDISGQPLRDHRGRIIQCRPDEVGVLLARIDAVRSYDGYIDLDHTHAEALANAVGDGTTYFNTDLRVRVHEGGFVSEPT